MAILLATWRKEILKADITGRNSSGPASGNQKCTHCIFLFPNIAFHFWTEASPTFFLADRVQKQLRMQETGSDGRGGEMRVMQSFGELLFVIHQIPHRNHCEFGTHSLEVD